MYTSFTKKIILGLVLILCSFHVKSMVSDTFSGTYTIGGLSADYATFNAAVSALDSFGVNGHTVFEINTGVYTEQFTLNNIAGLGPDATISFQSVTNDTADVHINFISSSSMNHIVRIENSDYIQFKGMTFSANSTSYGNVIRLIGHAKHLTFENCRFISKDYGSERILYGYNMILDSITIRKCSFTGSDYAIYLRSNNSASGFIIDSCSFFEQQQDAIYLYSLTNCQVSNNYITRSTYNGYVGVRMYYCPGKNTITNNYIDRFNSWGMYFYDCDGTATERMLIANNYIHSTGSSDIRGIYIAYSSYHDIFNNTVNLDVSNATSYALDIVYNGPHRIVNNILSNKEYPAASYQNFTIDQADYNCYWSNSATPLLRSGAAYNSLLNFQTATTLDSHSVFANPYFIVQDSLHPAQAAINNSATPLVEVDLDIYGANRSLTNPDMGCLEFDLPPVDAGIQVVIPPPSVFPAGNNEVNVLLTNHGTSTLNTVDIDWTVNAVLQSQINWSGTLAGGDTVTVSLGDYNFPINVNHTIKAFTTNPNSTTDNVNSNDSSFIINIFPGLSGTYTLGNITENFETFAQLQDQLNYGGVYGHVQIDILDGDYDEQIHLINVPGVGPSSTLLFTSQSSDKTKVSLTHFSISTLNYIMQIENTSHVQVKDISMHATSTSYGNVVRITGKVKHLDFENCDLSSADYGNETVFYANNIEIDSFNIKSCSFTGAEYGIYLKSTHQGSKFIIDSCVFNEQEKDAIYLYNIRNVNLKNNTILRENFNGYTGIRMYYCPGQHSIINNFISRNNSWGIYLYDCNALENERLLIANNYIYTKGTTDARGIYSAYSSHVDLYHNTISIESTSAISYGIDLLYEGPYNVKNNIIENKNFSAISFQNSTITSSDYNSFWSTSAVPLSRSGVGYASLIEYTAAQNLDSNSIFVNPYFIQVDSLIPGNSNINSAGIDLAEVTTDIYGQARSLNPDIGCFEFDLPTVDAGIDFIIPPAAPFATGNQDVYAILHNQSANALTTVDIEWRVNNVEQTTVAWTGNLASMDTTHVLLGTYSFPIATRHEIQANTSMPNSMSDAIAVNDTAWIDNVYCALSGSYSVNDTLADFNDLTVIQEQLNYGGVYGPVVFDIDSGDYNYQIYLNEFPGSTPINLVTFQSAVSDSAAVKWHFDSPSNKDYLIYLNGTKNIEFKNIAFKSDDANYGTIIIVNGATHLIIDSCLFISNDLYTSLIYGVGSVDSLEIKNSTFIGSGYGINIDGDNSGTYFSFDNNKATNTYYSAFYFRDLANISVSNNTINRDRNADYSLYLYSCPGNTRVFNNTISTASSGLYMYDCDASIGNKSLVYNNMISIYGNAERHGMITNYCARLNVVYNNINCLNTHVNSASLYSYYNDNTNILNNNLSTSTNATALKIFPNYGILESNNNNIYGTGTNLIRYYNINYSDLPAYASAIGFDSMSISVPPLYIDSLNDLHTTNVLLDKAAQPLVDVLEDFDGETRDPLNPDIGADEIITSLDDVAPFALIAPKQTFSAGTNDVVVEFLNNGVDTLYNFDVDLIINQTHIVDYDWSGNLPSGDLTSEVIIGNYNFIVDSNYTITIVSSLPNNNTDGDISNDTLTMNNVYAALEGTYTIGGVAPDFETINDAALAMENGGVIDSVLFLIRDGIYNEQIVFNSIIGVDSTNTITFRSESMDTAAVRITYNSSSTNNYTLQLNGIQNIRFEYLTIAAENTSYKRGIHISQSMDEVVIDHCRIAIFQSGSQSTQSPIIFSGVIINDFKLLYTRIENGSYPHFQGLNNNRKKVTIDHCQFLNQYNEGVYVRYVEPLIFTNNTIQSNRNHSAYEYLFAREIYGASIITGNHGSNSRIAGGFDFYIVDGLADRILIANNYAQDYGYSTNSNDGIRIVNAQNVDVINNTLRMTGTGRALYLETATDVLLNNNIFYSKTGAAVHCQNAFSGTNISSNNDLFTEGTNLVYNAGSNYTTLLAWQTASSQETNSLSVDPIYTDSVNYFISEIQLNKKGLANADVTVDIESTLRSNPPDIGCYEFEPPFANDIYPNRTANPDLSMPFAPGNIQLVAEIKNNGIDTVNNFDIYWSAVGHGLDTVNWSGTLLPAELVEVALDSVVFSETIPQQIMIVSKTAIDDEPANDTLLLTDVYAGCPRGNFVLTSQTMVNQFVQNYNGCSKVIGNLTISGATITDISGLSFINEITGFLYIYSTSLNNFSGLNNLQDIGNYLSIYNNNSLSSASGLNGQQLNIGGYLYIGYCTNLLEINAIQGIQNLGGYLTIRNNASLTNLNALSLLNQVSGNLNVFNNSSLIDCGGLCSILNTGGVSGSVSIYSNPSECSSPTEVTTLCSDTDCPQGTTVLTTQNELNAFIATYYNCDSLPGNLSVIGGNNISNISGLSFIQHVAGDLVIQSNYLIQDLNGFQNLMSVGGNLKIYNNSSIDSINHLANLNYIGGNLTVYNNDQLTSLSGLEMVDSIAGNLSITYNDQLSDCNVLCYLINNSKINGNKTIHSNPSTCSSLTELITLCSPDDCPSVNTVLTTQNEVNAFVQAYSNCDSLPVNLTIQGYNNIDDLSGLNFIQHIDGNLNIQNTYKIRSFEGFENLSSVNGNFYIQNNSAIQNFDSLYNLIDIGGDLNIYNNDSLQDINGLMSLDSIGNKLTVRYNDQLADCSGICRMINDELIAGTVSISSNPSTCSSLTEVSSYCSDSPCPSGDVVLSTQIEVNAFVASFTACDSLPGSLTIQGGNNINDISGLTFIKHINGNLLIKYNSNLTDLTGFDSLQTVLGNVKIESNQALLSLNKLSNLNSVGGELNIQNNDLLTTLQGLESINTIQSHLRIYYNDLLSDCSALCQLINNNAINGTIYVYGNPSPCSSTNQVNSFCQYGSLISEIYIQNLADTIIEGQVMNFDVAVDYAPIDTLIINLSSSNILEAPVPKIVTILPGNTSVNVNVTLPDDAIPENHETVTITAGAAYLGSASSYFLLSNEDDIPEIEIEIFQDTISEADGFYAAQGVVRRVVDDGKVINVTLHAGTPNSLILPQGVALNVNDMEKAFYIGTIDNQQVDGYRLAEITGKVRISSCNCPAPQGTPGYQSASVILSDNDGPTLTLLVNPLSMKEGLQNAGTLEIRRNTPTTSPLSVQLSVSDTSEMSLPAMVTIPQGFSKIFVPITTKTDTSIDGNQQVSIQATSAGFTSGNIWTIVTDINKPDLQVANVILPKSEIPSENYFQFRTFITNTGFSTSPVGTALTGYLSDDKNISASDFVIGTYTLDVAIPVGDTIEFTNLGLTPEQPKDYNLIFKVNSDEAIAELLYLNNDSKSKTLTVLPDYLGSAIVDETIYSRGSPIIIHGSTFKEGGTKVINADLEVYIQTNGLRREILVNTDSAGNYATVFQPINKESGHYSVGASYPDQESVDIQDEFDILGVQLNNGNYIIWELLLNDTLNNSMSIRNKGNVDLTNVMIHAPTLPNGAALSFDTLPALAANATSTINYKISGATVTSLDAYLEIPLNIVSDEAPIQTDLGYYICQAQTAHLISTIANINTSVNKDNSRFFEFQIINNGLGQSDDVHVNVPNVDWMDLVSSPIVPSMSPGDTSTIILEFIPTTSLPLNTPATGNISIVAENGNALNIPFKLEKVSDEKGGITIEVVDQFTYWSPGAPAVDSARVRITHYFTGEVYADGITDSLGQFIIDSLPEGTLRIVVDAHQHLSHDGLIYISPGLERKEVIFIEYQAISFTWSVVPTTIEDSYLIDLIMNFETNVPVPVVVIEMPDTMPQLFGDETYPFYVTMTNQGLITAQDVELELPIDPEYEFVTNYETQDLLAQQAIQVPVTLKRRTTPLDSLGNEDNLDRAGRLLGIGGPGVNNRSSGTNCRDVTYTIYGYECGDNGVIQRTGALFTWEGRICSGSGTPIYSSNTGYGNGPGSPSGGGCVGCPSSSSSSVPSVSIDCKCNDCLKNILLTGLGCAGSTFASVASCLISPSWLGCLTIPFAPLNCAIGVLSTAKLCYDQYTGDDLADLSNKSLRSGDVPSALEPALDDLFAFERAYEARIDIAKAYYQSLFDNDNFTEIIMATEGFILSESPIEAADSLYILNVLSNFDIDSTELSAFITRWNQSLDAWSNGVNSPNGQYPNIIDHDLLDAYQLIIDNTIAYVTSRGFADIDEMLNAAIDLISNFSIEDDPDVNPVCASVSISISQKLTMTREAFEGTLTIYNGHGTLPLDSLELNLEILDENGVNSNDLFEIETTELGVLTGIDGAGTLAAEEEGYAQVLFIPETGAAPTVPKSYSFGGSISYVDPFTGFYVTMPLTPVTLQVNPSPDLFLHYFMQRDILGDDPLTDPIEPILPGELAVMIENNGYGDAMQVVIESAQPVIIDNEKGLAVHFSLIGSNLQGQPQNLGLNTIDFGNIQPFKTKIGQWYFTSDLLGHFTSYQTNLVHLDSRGNPDLSLVSGAVLHELIHSIRTYGPTDDGIDDFLVNEIPDAEDRPDAIFVSQGNLVHDVYQASAGSFDHSPVIAGNTNVLTVDPLGLGWNYIKLDDPGNGLFEILSITRNADGQEIPLKNGWLTYVTIPDSQSPVYENKFHFVDEFASYDTTSYTIVWSPKDPNPPAIVSITGHPSQATSNQVSNLTVTFSEEIIDSTFTYADLVLRLQGGNDLIDNTVVITKIDSVTYDVDISNLTTGNGFYAFTVQAAEIKDRTGTNGQVGEQVTWTQFLSVPVIQSFIGLPTDYLGSAFDTCRILFNQSIDLSTLNPSDFTIKRNDSLQSGTLTITSIDMEQKLFKLAGLGSFMSQDADYVLEVDLTQIMSTENIFGLAMQSIILSLDTKKPELTNMVRSSVGALDPQHYTGITVNFDAPIQAFDSTAFILTKGGLAVDNSPIEILKVNPSWYEIRWNKPSSYPEGNYEFELDMTKIYDLASNNGTGLESQSWLVDRTPSLNISNLLIDPDLGFSATDGLTSNKNFNFSFDINEAARFIEVYQDDNGTRTLLYDMSSATAGSIDIPLSFSTGGNTSLLVEMEDLMGNFVAAEKSLFIDETAVNGVWDFATAQRLVEHPDSIMFLFDEAVVDQGIIPINLYSIKKGNNSLDASNLSFTRISSKKYMLIGLNQIDNPPGFYSIAINLAGFTKYSSGIKGNDKVKTTWEVYDPNHAPIANAGPNQVIRKPGLVNLDGSASSDIDGDQLNFRWYPPENVSLSDSLIVNPTFTLSQFDHGKSFTFLMETNDGKINAADIVRVDVKLDSIDFELSNVLGLNSTCNLNPNANLQLVIKNNGTYDYAQIPFTIKLDNTLISSGTITNTIAKGDSLIYSIPTTINASFNEMHNLECELVLNRDNNKADNKFNLIFRNDSLINDVLQTTPLQDAIDLATTIDVEWNAIQGAIAYDLYLWEEGQAVPSQAYISDLTDTATVFNNLIEGVIYHWQVKAKNMNCEKYSSIFTFTTELPGICHESGATTVWPNTWTDISATDYMLNGFPIEEATLSIYSSNKINFCSAYRFDYPRAYRTDSMGRVFMNQDFIFDVHSSLNALPDEITIKLYIHKDSVQRYIDENSNINSVNDIHMAYAVTDSCVQGEIQTITDTLTILNKTIFDVNWYAFEFLSPGQGMFYLYGLNCPADKYISLASDEPLYKSSNQIISNGIISAGNTVMYRSQNVSLEPGFEIKSNANFEIKIGGCSE